MTKSRSRPGVRKRQTATGGSGGGRKPWYQTPAALIAMIASVVTVIVGAITVYNANPWKSPPPQRFNAEVLIDSSSAFQAELSANHQTKLEAVQQGLSGAIGSVGSHDQIALRRFGGPCAGDNTRRLVDFAENDQAKITDAVAHLQVGGNFTLVRGIVEATSDLSKFGASSSTVHNRIIVITGGGEDACDSEHAIQTISDRVSAAKTPTEFRFIGVGVDPNERGQLEAIAKASRSPAPGYAQNGQEVLELARKELPSTNHSAAAGDSKPSQTGATGGGTATGGPSSGASSGSQTGPAPQTSGGAKEPGSGARNPPAANSGANGNAAGRSGAGNTGDQGTGVTGAPGH